MAFIGVYDFHMRIFLINAHGEKFSQKKKALQSLYYNKRM